MCVFHDDNDDSDDIDTIILDIVIEGGGDAFDDYNNSAIAVVDAILKKTSHVIIIRQFSQS